MDEKKLLKSLSDITAQLKGIADGLGVSTGVKSKTTNIKKASGLSKEELSKQKEITKLNVDEYQKTLGLNFKDKANLDKIAQRFKVSFETSTSIKLITNIRDNIKELKDKWFKQTAANLVFNSILDNIKDFKKIWTKEASKAQSINKKSSTDLLKGFGWEDFKTEILWNIREEENHRNFVVDSWQETNSLLGRLVGSAIAPKKEKKESSDIMGKLKNLGGLALLGGGMYLIIQALVNAGDIDLIKTLKVLGVVTAFLGLFWLVGEKLSKLKTASIGFAILAATIGLIVIPLIESLSKMPWEEYIDGLIKFGLIVLGFVGVLQMMEKLSPSNIIKSTLGFSVLSLVITFLIMPLLETIAGIPYDKILKGLFNFGLVVGGLSLMVKLIGKVFESGMKETLIGMATMVGLSFLMGYLADNLNKFASFDWKKIYSNLGLAVLALGLFGTVVFGIGAIVANPVVAPLLAIGAVSVMGLSFVMGMIADAASKFQDIDGSNLIEVGKGISMLGIGLASFLVGMAGSVASGIVGKIAGIFGLNPADQIKKFEDIDSDKIFKLGLGLKYMGDSLKMLSSGIDLKGITNQLMELTTPLMNFTFSLDKFNKAFADLDKTISKSEITNVYKLKIENENNIQSSILELNKRELEIQQAQLDELRVNGGLLKIIADNIASSGGSVGMSQQNPINKNNQSITSANFSTKNNYLNHMKLTSMSFAG